MGPKEDGAVAMPLPFEVGQWVVLVLRDPRERIWGRLLGLEPSGVALRGLDVKPWEEILQVVRSGDLDQLSMGTRYFPLHRVESMYLDEPSSGTPSLREEFLRRTGCEPGPLFGEGA